MLHSQHAPFTRTHSLTARLPAYLHPCITAPPCRPDAPDEDAHTLSQLRARPHPRRRAALPRCGAASITQPTRITANAHQAQSNARQRLLSVCLSGCCRCPGMAPLVSHVKQLGLIDAIAIPQKECFEATVRTVRMRSMHSLRCHLCQLVGITCLLLLCLASACRRGHRARARANARTGSRHPRSKAVRLITHTCTLAASGAQPHACCVCNAQCVAAAARAHCSCTETGESKVILTALCGHGHFDMSSYEKFLAGKLEVCSAVLV